MTEKDPYRAPDSEEEPQAGAIRPMSSAAAAGWSLVATFLFLFAAALAFSLRSEKSGDYLITGVTAQAVAYSLTLFFVLRLYGPEASIFRFLGVRPTATSFYFLGAALGLAMQLPINALYAALIQRWPLTTPSELQPYYDAASVPTRVMMGLALVAFGPIIEEMFFRGALFSPLLRRAGPFRPLVTVVLTAVLFAAVHMKWQDIVCIIPMGLILGLLRYKSGSLLPSIFAHASFNAVAMGQLAARQEDFHPSAAMIGVTTAASALVAVAIVWLGRSSEAAEAARLEDVS